MCKLCCLVRTWPVNDGIVLHYLGQVSQSTSQGNVNLACMTQVARQEGKHAAGFVCHLAQEVQMKFLIIKSTHCKNVPDIHKTSNLGMQHLPSWT